MISFSELQPEIAADDWGFSIGINEGILELAHLGIIRTVSLIANAPHLNHGLSELKKVKGLNLAWHMNFTAGKPLIQVSEASSFVQKQTGNLHPLKKFMWNWWRGKIEPSEITREARAQIQLLTETVGELFEADGHHHVHLVPGVFELIEPLYHEFGIKNVRLPMEKTHVPSYVGSQLIWWRKKNLRLKLRSYGYPQRRHFNSPQEFLRVTKRGQRPVLVHPAAFDDFKNNPYGDTFCEERVHQYQSLRKWFS